MDLGILVLAVLEGQVDSTVLGNLRDCNLENSAKGSSFDRYIEKGLDPVCLIQRLKIDLDFDGLDVFQDTD